MQDLNALAKKIHENAKAKGFYDTQTTTSERFMLIISEAGEALEAHRKGKLCKVVDFEKWMYRYGTESVFQNNFEVDIKDTFQDEIADIVIRILDYCAYCNISIPKLKHDFPNHMVGKSVGAQLLMITKRLCLASDRAMIGTNKQVANRIKIALEHCFYMERTQDFDLMQHIELKMQYNATRERLHGKKY